MITNQALLPIQSNSANIKSLNCKFVKKSFITVIKDIISGVLTYFIII